MNCYEKSGKGTLYIVATPVGNLEDITFRATRILNEVDIVAAEDTRHSRKLLSHLGISKPLTSYFDHNKDIKGVFIIQKLVEGLSVALISDAGTPCISDPGYQLVRDAVAAGIHVVPIPGPSAFLAALSASGLQTDSFAFEGFLPSRQGKRRTKLNELKDEHRLLIFYESPNRLLASLTDMLEVLGDRRIAVAREITKIHEEFLRGALSEIITGLNLRKIKGEVVILVSPGVCDDKAEELFFCELLAKYLIKQNISLKDAVQRVAKETGVKRGKVYAEALRIKKK
jgi:16S rRNA (cytidine1402-2'-O)-methyltransferase